MNNLRKQIRELLIEGTWSLPETISDVAKVKKTIMSLKDGAIDYQELKDELYDVLGNDGLFDKIDEAIRDEVEEYDKQHFFIISSIQRYLVDLLKQYKNNPKDFKHPIEVEGIEKLTSWIEGLI